MVVVFVTFLKVSESFEILKGPSLGLEKVVGGWGLCGDDFGLVVAMFVNFLKVSKSFGILKGSSLGLEKVRGGGYGGLWTGGFWVVVAGCVPLLKSPVPLLWRNAERKRVSKSFGILNGPSLGQKKVWE